MGKSREMAEARIMRLYGELGGEGQRIVYGLIRGLQPKGGVATRGSSKRAAKVKVAAATTTTPANGSDAQPLGSTSSNQGGD